MMKWKILTIALTPLFFMSFSPSSDFSSPLSNAESSGGKHTSYTHSSFFSGWTQIHNSLLLIDTVDCGLTEFSTVLQGQVISSGYPEFYSIELDQLFLYIYHNATQWNHLLPTSFNVQAADCKTGFLFKKTSTAMSTAMLVVCEVVLWLMFIFFPSQFRVLAC